MIKSFEDLQKEQNAPSSGTRAPRYLWGHQVLEQQKSKPRGERPSPLLEEYMQKHPDTRHALAKFQRTKVESA